MPHDLFSRRMPCLYIDVVRSGFLDAILEYTGRHDITSPHTTAIGLCDQRASRADIAYAHRPAGAPHDMKEASAYRAYSNCSQVLRLSARRDRRYHVYYYGMRTA